MTDTFTYTDRKTMPWQSKINPFWWFANDSNQTVDQAPWYHGPDTTVPGYMGPPWSEFRRQAMWNLIRNPLQNFRSYVVGVQDKNYTVTGKARDPNAPANVEPAIQRNDLPGQSGWQWSVIHLNSVVKLPFVSYSGKRIVWYAGWQPNGFFGFKVNVHSS
jgi:hypothetical protein